jgi:hypothetical protein
LVRHWQAEVVLSAQKKGNIQIRSSEEEHMCPVCIANAAVMVAGAGSAGGILAVCIGKFRKFFGAFQNTKEN